MYFDAQRDMCPTPELMQAVEAGISAREKRVQGAKVRDGAKGKEDEMFKQELLESAWRMQILIEAVEEGVARRAGRAAEGVVVQKRVEVDRSDPVARAKALAAFEAELAALD